MENIILFVIMFIITLLVSILWVQGIDNNKDVKSDNCGWLE
jgi:hypothetical protein